MFGLFKTKFDIIFNQKTKEQFNLLLTEIHEILRDSAYLAQAKWIILILSSVQKEDSKKFQQRVISAELLGGAGSIVDVWLEDEEKMKRLNCLLNAFFELTIKSGLNHRVIKSRMIKK
ncbi:hypothetical protein [Pontimicrobium sp. IMCC45349]|uniref:hypothetical protein n=1 Tax=Pontimicrobium sp. IMCC45349 TaxID=3391574 RepID=UPI0039A1CD66